MNELIDQLVSQVKVNETQARGGTGVILKAVREKLGPVEFGKVTAAIPGFEDLARQVPEAGGFGKLFGGFASAVGGQNGALLANIVTGFGRLGLTTEHAKSFAPVILEFVRTRVGWNVRGTVASL